MSASEGRSSGGDAGLYVCPADGPCLADDPALSDLIGDLFSSGARFVAIPLARLGPEFLRLSSGVAGHVLQKLVNYHFRVAILGDVSQAAASSGPLRDFIRESNRGTTVWFVADLAELEARLRDAQPSDRHSRPCAGNL